MDQIKPYKILFGTESSKLKLDGLELQCYILEGGQHVIIIDSIQKAMGYKGKSKNWLFEFLMHINRLTLIDPALLEALARKIALEAASTVAGDIKYGIEANRFLEACQAIMKAKDEGFLYLSELTFAKAAEKILKSTEEKGIGKLIDFATGFELYKNNHKEALLRFYLKNSGQKSAVWLRSFPDDFFEMIFKFRGWNWRDLNINAQMVAGFLNDMVFSRIAPRLLEELEESKPKMKYRKKNTQEEYLEHPGLSTHLLGISALMTSSGKSLPIFEQLLTRTFPRQNELKFPGNETHDIDLKKQDEKLSEFNETLKKALTQKGSNKLK